MGGSIRSRQGYIGIDRGERGVRICPHDGLPEIEIGDGLVSHFHLNRVFSWKLPVPGEGSGNCKNGDNLFIRYLRKIHVKLRYSVEVDGTGKTYYAVSI